MRGFGISLTNATNAYSASNVINSSGSPTIEGISDKGLAYGIYSNARNTGTILVKGADVKAVSTSNNAFGINNQGAKSVTITGTNAINTKVEGTSTSATGYGIYNNVGTLKVWNTEATTSSINKNYPLITGSTYGVHAGSGSEFEWYDGKLVGKTAFTGKEPSLLDECKYTTTTSNSVQTSVITLK